MVLSRLTKITGPGIRTDTNWVGNNANYTGILTASSLGGIGNLTATGIITASSFSGDGSGLIGVASTDNIITGTAATFNTYPVDINAGMTVAGVATFAGNVSIAGTLTYEDVTNIDSVGLVTARTGFVSPYADIDDFVDVGSNIQLGNAGVITATTFKGDGDFVELDVDGHTNLDNVSIAGVVTATDLTVEKSGNLSVNIKSTGGYGALEIGGTSTGYIDIKKPFSADYDLRLMHDGSNSYITSADKPLHFDAYSYKSINIGALGQTDLRYAGNVKLKTETGGVSVTGILTATSFSGDGSNLTGITQTTINNNANNRVITGSGSANTLEGEANLTFDGAELDLNNSGGSARLYLVSGNSADSSIYFGRQNDGATGGIRYEHTNDSLQFMGYNNSERLRINSSGKVRFGSGDPSYTFEIQNSGNIEFLLGSTNAGGASIIFDGDANGDGGGGDYAQIFHDTSGDMNYRARGGSGASNHIFLTGTDERLRITSGGTVVIGDSASATPTGKLHLYQASNDSYMYIQRGSGNSQLTIGGIYWKNSGNNLGLIDVQSQDVNDAVMRFYTMGGGTLSERFRLRNNNTGGVALITSPASGDTLNLQTDAGGGQGMIFGTDTSGSHIYLKNNSSGHFGFQYKHGATTQLEITSGGKVQLPTANSTNTYLNVKNIGISRISTSERLAITDIGAVAYDYELDDIMVYRSSGYWSGIDNPRRRGRIRTQNLRVALNFDIGYNPQDNALLAATVFHNLDYGSSFAISGSVASTLRTSSGLDDGPYWNRQMAGGNVDSNFIVADLGGNATTQEVSLCCWYKSQSNDSEGTGSGGQYGPAIALFGDTRGSVWGGFGITSRKPDFSSNGGVHNIATSAPSVVDGNWHHIVFTYDGPNADLKIYVDGTLYLTNNSVSCSSNTRYDRIAGHYNYTYTHYPFNMANVLIYDRIISANDVKGIYYARTFYRDTI